MRVLVVSDWYPKGCRDPSGVFVRNHALAASRDHHVVVVHLDTANGSARYPRIEEERDGPLRTLRLRRPARWPITPTNLAALMLVLRRLRRSGFVPDVLHAHEVGAGFAALTIGRANGLPVVVSEHCSDFALGAVRGITARLAAATFRRADLVCPVSESLRARMEDDGWHGRFRVVPNVIDTERFKPGPPPGAGRPRIIAAAALVPVKGIGDLIEAAGLLRRRREDFQLDVAGDGPLRPQLTQRIRKLGLEDHVVLHGTLAPDELATLTRSASFAVVPSIWETFSVFLGEAMACGLPVVATAVGAMVERVHPGNGLLVPAGDHELLAEAMSDLLDRHHTYDHDAIAADVRAQFSPAAVASHWDAVYAEAIMCRDGS